MKKHKFGFFHYSPLSNKRLIELFERNQKLRYGASDEDWADKEFTMKLRDEEIRARKAIIGLLRRGEITTADDFYRAGHFFHHSLTFRDYALGLTLFAASHHLGELWGKNYYAVALDRFLLSIKQPQYFGTQFERKKGKWLISSSRENVSDKERKKYLVEPLEKMKKRVNKMNEAISEVSRELFSTRKQSN